MLFEGAIETGSQFCGVPDPLSSFQPHPDISRAVLGIKMLWACARSTRPQGDLSRAGGIPGIDQLDRACQPSQPAGGAPRKSMLWPTLTGPGERW